MLLLGDLAHDTIMKIFTYSEAHEREDRLAWDVLLAPHHCSKYVMYARRRAAAGCPGRVRAARTGQARSSWRAATRCQDATTRGDNPPHANAKARYLQILDGADSSSARRSGPSDDRPAPVVFGLGATG